MTANLTAAQRAIAAQSRLLATMPESLRTSLLDSARVVHLVRGKGLFHQGDVADAIHIVVDGWIKLYRIAPNGTEAVVGIMTRGQSFGEPIALRRAAYPVSATAATNCQLIALPAAAILAQLSAQPEAAISVLASTFLHLQGLVEQIEQLKAQSGSQRVAEFLLELCPEGAESATVTLPYDKILIAGRLGMKPESLSRAFARLRDYGVTIHHASATIASVSALRELTRADAAAPWMRAS